MCSQSEVCKPTITVDVGTASQAVLPQGSPAAPPIEDERNIILPHDS